MAVKENRLGIYVTDEQGRPFISEEEDAKEVAAHYGIGQKKFWNNDVDVWYMMSAVFVVLTIGQWILETILT